jgi:hypothetical protein
MTVGDIDIAQCRHLAPTGKADTNPPGLLDGPAGPEPSETRRRSSVHAPAP